MVSAKQGSGVVFGKEKSTVRPQTNYDEGHLRIDKSEQ